MPFFIDDADWNYKYKEGWHDYFTSLKVFDNSTNSTEKYANSSSNAKHSHKISEYIDCIKEIFTPKDHLIQMSKDKIKSIGGPYTSIYVRRGDKLISESKHIAIPDILNQLNIHDDGRTVFVQTDDYTVVEELKRVLPSCKIETLTPSSNLGAAYDQHLQKSPDEKKKDFEELIVSILVFLEGGPCWTDLRSNIGRLHKLLGFDKVKLYPIDESKNISLNANSHPSYSF